MYLIANKYIIMFCGCGIVSPSFAYIRVLVPGDGYLKGSEHSVCILYKNILKETEHQ